MTLNLHRDICVADLTRDLVLCRAKAIVYEELSFLRNLWLLVCKINSQEKYRP